jgi:hypothetical protein
MKRMLALAALTACGFEHGALDNAGDAHRDGNGSGSAQCAWSYTPTNFDPCALPAPMPLTVSQDTSIDSTTVSLPKVTLTQTDGTSLVVIHLTTMTVSAKLTVTGAATTFAVDGDVTITDVITAVGGNGNATQCATVKGSDGHDSTSPTGGAGGGGGAAGADMGGAGGDGMGIMAGTKGNAGTFTASTLSPLRGGCSGGKGGRPNGLGAAPEAGRGGGAIQISTDSKISFTDNGFIDAAGRGGAGTTGKYGGGGGGGGGGIFLEGPMISIASVTGVCADGGSGSEGGGQNAFGYAGMQGQCSALSYATTFQNSGTYGGDGGRGSFRGNPNGGAAGNAGGDGGGGGGGGGAVGWIRLKSPTLSLSTTAIVTPAPQTN